jgi:predicted membrane-bound dolichyl-phosphate-mannose-protein mannosyltransferase
MVVVVVAIVVFVFAVAVYTTLRLSASKPISTCSKKIRLFATVYLRVFV